MVFAFTRFRFFTKSGGALVNSRLNPFEKSKKGLSVPSSPCDRRKTIVDLNL